LTPQSSYDSARLRGVQKAVALLNAAIERLQMEDEDGPSESVVRRVTGTEIFIVHGHDEGRKEMVARFVQGLTGKTPIILHEQYSGSATIIEKLERYGGAAGYAIVVATGDDVGREAADTGGETFDRPRARRNVILELGYFYGLLGRDRVALLFEPGVERPSDADGILHVPIDSGREWRIELAKEIAGAGFEVDRSAIR
jgi:predicted nucleotide-binding protein